MNPGDKVCDIGCGDGRVLIHLAAHWTTSIKTEGDEEDRKAMVSSVSFMGLDINQDRIEEATSALKLAKETGRVHPDLSVKFYCANAMDSKHLYASATIFFLYLIPRGLKIFKPLLLEVVEDRIQDTNGDNKEDHSEKIELTVFTYMSPLPGEKYVKRELCEVAHQPGTAWPVYLYYLTGSSSTHQAET